MPVVCRKDAVIHADKTDSTKGDGAHRQHGAEGKAPLEKTACCARLDSLRFEPHPDNLQTDAAGMQFSILPELAQTAEKFQEIPFIGATKKLLRIFGQKPGPLVEPVLFFQIPACPLQQVDKPAEAPKRFCGPSLQKRSWVYTAHRFSGVDGIPHE